MLKTVYSMKLQDYCNTSVAIFNAINYKHITDII